MDNDEEEENNESVTHRNSDDDGEYSRDFDDTMRVVKLERSRVLLGYDGIDQAGEEEMKYVLLCVADNLEPDEVKVPKAPYEWVEPDLNKEKGEPTFDKVDNRGRWSSISHRPIFL